MTRMEAMIAKGLQPDMPPPGALAHLAEYLFEAGPVSHSGAGTTPLGWQEILAWQQATGIELQTYEARALRRLSTEYVIAMAEAEDPNAPPPFVRVTEEKSAHVDRAIRSIFGNRAKG